MNISISFPNYSELKANRASVLGNPHQVESRESTLTRPDTDRNNDYSEVVSLTRDNMGTDEVMLRETNESPSEYLNEKRYLAVYKNS